MFAGFGREGCKRLTSSRRPFGGFGVGSPSRVTLDPLRLIEHVHGHLGWLAAAALLHPAILLRNPRRKAPLSVGLSTAIVTATGALGVFLYGPYRDRLKQRIFLDAPQVGLLFERKEHLAFGAVLLAWSGVIAYFVADRARDEVRSPLRKFAFRAFVLATALAFATAALGTVVATYKTF